MTDHLFCEDMITKCTHRPVLVMIISVPNSWNLSHKSLVSRRHLILVVTSLVTSSHSTLTSTLLPLMGVAGEARGVTASSVTSVSTSMSHSPGDLGDLGPDSEVKDGEGLEVRESVGDERVFINVK